MTEQKFEQSIEASVESFADWAWNYKLIIGGIIFLILLIVGLALLKKNKKNKKNGGYICLGISVLVLVSDVIKAMIRIF